MLIAGGATLGVALQAILLLFFWRRTGLRFRPDFRWRSAGLGAPARAALAYTGSDPSGSVTLALAMLALGLLATATRLRRRARA
jgi:putative peptidoglycan lipid II flippase